MKQIMLSLAAAMAMTAASNSRKVYEFPTDSKPKRNPDYRPKETHRELREFCIKGEKIMAYSRKDAIVRLRHKKK